MTTAERRRPCATAPCGRCGAETDLELHGHYVCFPCARLWERWRLLHPPEGPQTSHRAGHQHDAWVDAYTRFLAEGKAA